MDDFIESLTDDATSLAAVATSAGAVAIGQSIAGPGYVANTGRGLTGNSSFLLLLVIFALIFLVEHK